MGNNEELYDELYYKADKYIKHDDSAKLFYTSTDIDDIIFVLTDSIDDERFESYLDDYGVDNFDVKDFAKYVITRNAEINKDINENNTVTLDIDKLPKALDDIDEPRPNRMKRPSGDNYGNRWKCGRKVHRGCVYIQDEAEQIMQDKYGRERGTKMWESSIGQGARGNAMFSIADKIMKEKAFLFDYFKVSDKKMADYWSISYYALWKLWMDSEGFTYKVASNVDEQPKKEDTKKPKEDTKKSFDEIIEQLYDTVEPDEKDYDRIFNILNRANGDHKKELKLASNMANSIKDVKKAYKRFRAAEQENFHEIAGIFYERIRDLIAQNESFDSVIDDVKTITNFKEKYKHGDTVYYNGKPHVLDSYFKDVAVLIDNDGDKDFVDVEDLIKQLDESLKSDDELSRIEVFKILYPENSKIYYRDRTGTVEFYLKNSAIIYFPDTGDSEDIDIEELIQQNESKINERKLTEQELEYFEFLNDLRESGITNMFGASPYLSDEFGLDNEEAKKILMMWMTNFEDDVDEYKNIDIED